MGKKIIIIVVVIVLMFIGYRYLFKKQAPTHAMPPVPVLAGKAVQKIMPVQIEQIGTVEAYNSITIYSRVMGQLKKIHFKEGQDVNQGDMLFTIDPAPYQEKLRNAEAKLAQDDAQLQYNKSEADRYKYLVERGAVSKSDYENKLTISLASEAMVKADKADVDNAKTNLSYCYIKAPIAGRTGQYGVREGTMVKENDTKLAVINQMTPIYVKFSVSEKQLPDVRRFMASGPLKVQASVPGFKDKIQEGTLNFIDNTVDTTTGMILLKATFPNKERFLWPGQFVNVILKLYEEKDAIVVPYNAVQIAQDTHYIFVVKPDHKVEYRTVKISRTIGQETVVTQGVNPGETVVTDGHLKLRDGVPVEIRDSLIKSNQENAKNKAIGNIK